MKYAIRFLVLVLGTATAFAGFPSAEVFLPSVGRTAGAGGSRWDTTVWLTNLSSTATVSFTFEFLAQGRDNRSPAAAFSDSLLPGETKVYENVVSGALGLTDALGAARIVSDGEILATERIFDESAGGGIGETQGFSAAAIPKELSIGPGASATIQGLDQNGGEDVRTNFVLVETSGSPATVDVAVLDAKGATLGEKSYALSPFEPVQANVEDVVPGFASTDARLAATVTSAGGSVILYGAQIANGSQDPTGFEMSFPDLLTSGVTSVNGLTGALTLEAGSNVEITRDGNDALRISSTAAAGPPGPQGAPGIAGPPGPPGPPGPSATGVSTDTPNTLAMRNANGSFAMRTLTLDGVLRLPATTSNAGILVLGGNPFLHAFGVGNAFVGAGAGNLAMSGCCNTGVGTSALFSNTSGFDNTAVGLDALDFNTSGSDNTAVGFQALFVNTFGLDCTAIGSGVLSATSACNADTAVGAQALAAEQNGFVNTAIGLQALAANTSGAQNTAAGAYALSANSGGNQNTAVGFRALQNGSGSDNVAVGYQAGRNVASGDHDIEIGNDGNASDSGVIRIGTHGTQTRAFVAGIDDNPDAVGTTAVCVSASGELGVCGASSRRFKTDVADVGDRSGVLLALRPVSFRYRRAIDPSRAVQYGLIAEEVAKTAPELVRYGGDGSPVGVRYEQVNALLLDVVQKQQREIRALEERLQRVESDASSRARSK